MPAGVTADGLPVGSGRRPALADAELAACRTLEGVWGTLEAPDIAGVQH